VKNINPLLALILALQVKVLLALPLFLVATGLIGLQSLAAGLVSAALSGASLLRSLLAAPATRPGSSSRVAYEVRTPPGGGAVDPYFYPPSALGALPQRQPDVRVISAATNN